MHYVACRSPSDACRHFALVSVVSFLSIWAPVVKGQSLHLRLEQSSALPDRSQPTGGTIGPDGAVITWDRAHAGFLRLRGRGVWERFGSSVPHPVGAYTDSSGALIALDASGMTIALFPDGTEDVSRSARIQELQGVVLDAVHAAGSWFALVRLDSLKDAVVEVGSDRVARTRVALATNRPRHQPFALSAAAKGAILTERGDPFVSRVLLSGTSSARVLLEPRRAPELTKLLGADAHTWVAMPVLDLGTGFLQVLADTRSDERLLVTYDVGGRVVRCSRLTVPVGLFAAASRPRLIIGLADLGTPSIEIFRWEW